MKPCQLKSLLALLRSRWYSVKHLMTSSKSPSPLTAHPELQVSEDRENVRQNGTWVHLREDNGKRFMSSPCVLGSEGFTSGRHYWEAEMRNFHGWTLGVAAESVERKGWVKRSPKAGVWSIRRSGELFEAFTTPATSLPVRPIPNRVGVYLSYKSGTVSFYDADTKSHLHTFNGYKFTEKLYPFFWVRGGNWMRIGSGSAPGV